MKLRELIVKLQAIEKSSPAAEVSFRLADVHKESGRCVFLLAVEGGDGEDCQIVVGDRDEEVVLYEKWQAGLKSQKRG